jgi:outer membrane receptor protein involved in Fe transport
MRSPVWTGFGWSSGILQMQPTDELAPVETSPAVDAEVSSTQASEEPPVLTEMLSDEELLAQALADAESDAANATGSNEVITITGSAIGRTETTTSSPVSVLEKADLEAAGRMTVGDILQDLPSQSNGINTNFNNGGDGSTRINLRGLGSSRTLVLVNGRRHVAGGTGANSSVDLNAIPLAAIERVEVLKDGASAIYGSDAIGGVVNIITRRDLDKAEVNLYTGSSQRGDGTVNDLSFVIGQTSKKGSVVFSAGYSDQRPMWAGDRDYSQIDREWDFEANEPYHSGSTAPPEGYVGDDPALGDAVCPSGACWRNPSTGQWEDFSYDGNSDVGEGSLYNYQPGNYLVTPLTRYNIFANGDYRLHKNVRSFFETSFMNRKSDQKLAPEPVFTIFEGMPVSGESVYNPFGRDLTDVRRRMVEAGNRSFIQDVNTFRFVAGLDGNFPVPALEGWKWESSFNYGRTAATEVKEGLLQLSHVRDAVGPSYRDADGVARCGTPTEPGPEGCVPLDLLGGEGSITPEMLQYLTYTGTANGHTQQQVWSAKAGGPIMKTPWDGDITLALGVSHRREAGGFQPDPLTATGDTTGNKGEPTAGKYNVSDAYAELSVVPVTDHAAAKWLEVNGAARGVNYDTFGSALTWKTGALWKINGGFAVRGTYGTAFRAPNIGELFSGQSDSFPSAEDPCSTLNGPLDPVVAANCLADGIPVDYTDDRTQLPARVGGNPQLDAEKANILTTGIVYEPTFLEGFAATVDYFRVSVNNAIQARGANIILSNCYSQVDRADCDKIQRNGMNLITEITDTASNIGGNDTDGIDFGLQYDVAGPLGRFRHSFEGTWLNEYNARFPNRTVEGVGVYDLGVFPRWKFNLATQWAKDGIGLGANARYIHHFRECEADDCDGDNPTPSRKVDLNITGDVYANYAFKTPAGDSTVALGVNNVTDQDPALIYQGFLADSDGSTYDYMGRYFYLRFSQSY